MASRPRQGSVRFFRHAGIYRSDVAHKTHAGLRRWTASRWSGLSTAEGRGPLPRALLIVRDEFRPAIPRSGCSPAEPVSASPAGPW